MHDKETKTMNTIRTMSLRARAGVAVGALAMFAAGSLAGAATLEEVLEKHVKALGGRDAIAKIASIQREADVAVEGQFGPMEGLMELKSVPGKKAWQSLDLGVFFRTSGWDGGDKGWEDNAMEGLKDVEGDALGMLRGQSQVSPLVAPAEGVELTLLEDAKTEPLPTLAELAVPPPAPGSPEEAAAAVEGPSEKAVDCHVLEMGPAGGSKAKVFVRKDDGMVFQIRSTQESDQFGVMEMVIEYPEFEEFEGVKLPKVMIMATGEMFTMEATFTKTTVNGELDESVFKMPEPPAPPASAPAAPAAPAPAAESK